MVQRVKNLPAMWKTRVQSLDRKDPAEKGMATHSSILARRVPWTEEPGGLQSTGLQRVRHNLSHVVTETDSQAVSGTSFPEVPSRFGVRNRGCLEDYIVPRLR